MGICYSRLERQEAVARCKARRRYMKQLVKARHSFFEAHTCYLRSLCGTGAALLQFASAESHFGLQHHLPTCPPSPTPLPPPPPPPPISPSSATWTSTSPGAPPPPPPPPPAPSGWDFWDPFASSPLRFGTEESGASTTASEVVATSAMAAAAAAPSIVSELEKDTASELEKAVSTNSKDLAEIIKELDEYFLKAADAGSDVSLLLADPSSVPPNQRTNKVYNYSRGLSPLLRSCGSNSKLSGVSGFGSLGEEAIGGDGGGVNKSHCSTIEKLYAWEKKLHQEVKNAESIKIDHEKMVAQLRKQEAKGAEQVKIDKSNKLIEKLESRMMLSSQAMETTSEEIIRLREAELYPQLLELVKGLMCMWRSMYECHQVQTRLVQQLKLLNIVSETEPTSEMHYKSTLQLELEVQQWHSAFCNLVKTQKDYVCSLTGWLRLSLFQFNHHPLNKTQQNSIYSLTEEWQIALDRIPYKVTAEGIKSFLTVIRAIVLQQAEEQKQKKKSEAALKELAEKVAALQSFECKYSANSVTENSVSGKRRNPVAAKRAEVETQRAKAKEEKTKHDKSVSMTRVRTLNNLQTGFPNMFQAMTGFSSVCMEAFESVYNKLNISDQGHDFKKPSA